MISLVRCPTVRSRPAAAPAPSYLWFSTGAAVMDSEPALRKAVRFRTSPRASEARRKSGHRIVHVEHLAMADRCSLVWARRRTHQPKSLTSLIAISTPHSGCWFESDPLQSNAANVGLPESSADAEPHRQLWLASRHRRDRLVRGNLSNHRIRSRDGGDTRTRV
jgi:hypothetical protein